MTSLAEAFNTVAYETVLPKLSKMGFSKKSMEWMRSYLTDQSQYVQVNYRLSEQIGTDFGVPHVQGSLLGPILLNLYVNVM